MFSLIEWAQRHGISAQAVRELAALSIVHDGDDATYSEAGVASRVRLEGQEKGVYLWRNNVGAGRVDGNRFMRWGLANDSDKLNEKLKSGDLIGIRRTLITPDMVGQIVGRFVSRETKHTEWKFSGSLHDMAQLNWCTLINGQGGDAKIVCGPGSFD